VLNLASEEKYIFTMLKNVSECAPPWVRSIIPYQTSKPITELVRDEGVPEDKIIKLDSNENPRGCSPRTRESLIAALPTFYRYPDGNGFKLKRALSQHLDVEMNTIVLGNGSNDILELVALAFLAPGCSAVMSQYAFAIFPLATQARGARSIVVPAKDWGHDLTSMLAAIEQDTHVLWIANPTNPTGTMTPWKAVENLLDRLPEQVMVVLDEAYHEYLSKELQANTVSWLKKYPNLIITRTFSKIYGLAGLRIGYALAHPSAADIMNRVRQPFNVNSLALAAATAALDDNDYVEQSAALNRQGMSQLEEGLSKLSLDWIPSYGNFVTVRVPNATRVYNALLTWGVIVRPLAAYQMPEYLRVTIGTEEENDIFLCVLKSILEDRKKLIH